VLISRGLAAVGNLHKLKLEMKVDSKSGVSLLRCFNAVRFLGECANAHH